VADPLLRVERLVRRFGGILATDNLSLDVISGELHAIIGPNGAGKTTLISQLTGQLLPNSGTIHFAGQDITRLPAWRRSALGLARSFQIPRCCPTSPHPTMSRWRRRRMTGTRFVSGAALEANSIFARRRSPRWLGLGSLTVPTPWCRS